MTDPYFFKKTNAFTLFLDYSGSVMHNIAAQSKLEL